jgi:hypothetical protein
MRIESKREILESIRKVKIKIRGDGQECPSYTRLASPAQQLRERILKRIANRSQ